MYLFVPPMGREDTEKRGGESIVVVWLSKSLSRSPPGRRKIVGLPLEASSELNTLVL